jgi:tetratricopeptide (TPR) repeat protein
MGLKYHRVTNMRRAGLLFGLISPALFAQEIDSLRYAASLHPNEVKPHFDLGNAYLYGTAPDFKVAEEEYRRVLELDPNYKQAYYSLGMIAWARFYRAWLAARANLQMNLGDPGPLRDPIRQEMKAEYSSMLEEGISNLNRALQIDPDYYQAMQTLNLLVVGRADLRDTKEEYASDVAAAKRRQGEMEARMAPTPPAIPPPPPSPDGSPTRIHVGGKVQAANIIKKIEPVYPEDARKPRVGQGSRYGHRQQVDGLRRARG